MLLPRWLLLFGVALAVAVPVVLAGCAAKSPASPPAAGDNSRNSLDWQGAYSGVVPCADCEGIRMRIELRGDGTFGRSLTYLGENVPPVTDEGTFAWDAAGARITLRANGRDTRFQVGENALLPLDADGNPLPGDRAQAYRLEKLVNDPRIEGRRWQLFELNGQPVETPATRGGAFFELDAAEARVTGNASCNRFFGSYELKANSRLSFPSDFGATLMACPDLERERAFLEMLKRVDNYTLGDGGMLSLNRARMAPLARFREDR